MKRPHVYLNMAMTADGKITSAAREYPKFTSAFDKKNMDRLRARADAVLIGAGTLRADDPPLHVRDAEMQAYRESLGKQRELVHVLVSGSLSVDPDSGFFNPERADSLIVATVDEAPAERVAALEGKAEVWRVGSGRVDMAALLERLHERGVEQLLAEGGGELNWALAQADLLDELFITVAPSLLGGREAPTLLEGPGFAMADQTRLELADLTREGDEIYLRYRVLR
ncbi:hypothetical protein ABI59_09515 [Acidobacteria bacterium Mor1]|nr:hypothetical protein ABI59_09515 [Acidobacteria bacterium Mor1]